MSVILDANALINLYHAGVLSSIYLATECIVPAEVYDEVITKGQQAGHADAGEIAEVIGPRTAELVDIPPELGRMGLGEAAVLSLYVERRGSAGNEDSIVSDDRQFLRYLQRREQRERVVIRRLNTSQFIAESAVSGLMTKPQAMEALTKIINRVPDQHYNFAIQLLELL